MPGPVVCSLRLSNVNIKFQDFPGFSGPVQTLTYIFRSMKIRQRLKFQIQTCVIQQNLSPSNSKRTVKLKSTVWCFNFCSVKALKILLTLPKRYFCYHIFLIFNCFYFNITSFCTAWKTAWNSFSLHWNQRNWTGLTLHDNSHQVLKDFKLSLYVKRDKSIS